MDRLCKLIILDSGSDGEPNLPASPDYVVLYIVLWSCETISPATYYFLLHIAHLLHLSYLLFDIYLDIANN